MTVKLKNGTAHQMKVDHCKGTPENPLTAQELENKFRGLASVSATPAQVDEIVRLVSTLDQQKDLSGLIAQLSIH